MRRSFNFVEGVIAPTLRTDTELNALASAEMLLAYCGGYSDKEPTECCTSRIACLAPPSCVKWHMWIHLQASAPVVVWSRAFPALACALQGSVGHPHRLLRSLEGFLAGRICKYLSKAPWTQHVKTVTSALMTCATKRLESPCGRVMALTCLPTDRD